MGKRGELTSMQIALLIFALLGLIIGILFFISIKDNNYSQDEMCKISVLSRATSDKVVEGIGQAVPLQCTTKKICITTSGSGSCDQFKGESAVTNVVLPSGETEAIHLIEKTSAEAMYNCWELMGQGKLDIFNNVEKSLGLHSAEPTCVICSRIAVDKKVSASLINQVNVNRYLENNYVPGTSLTYVQAFSNQAAKTASFLDPKALSPNIKNPDTKLLGINDIYGSGQDNQDILRDAKGNVILDSNGKQIPINREMAYVFMQIRQKSTGEIWKNQLAAGSIMSGGAFMTSKVPVVGNGVRYVWSLLPGDLKIGGSLVVAAAVAGYGVYNSVQGQQVAAGYCGGFVSKEAESTGCSLVEGVNYNVNDINALCDTIQGNP